MILARLRAVYPGWWLAGAASVSLATSAGMTFWAFGLYVEPLEEEFGWSRAVIAAGVSLTLLVSALTAPIVGRLVDRYGPRAVIAVGTPTTAALYLAMSQFQVLWQFFLLLGILAFFRTFMFYIPLTTLITRWFTRRRATAMGIATSGFGLGGLVFLPLMAVAISAVGWRASFWVAAGLVLVINGVLLLFARDDPSDRWAEQEQEGDSRAGPTDRGLVPLDSSARVFRTRVFWLAAAGFSLFFFAQWAFLFHAIPFFEGEGLSTGQAALILSGAAGLGVFLRLSTGFFIDRLRSYEALAVAVLLLMAAALCTLLISSSLGAILFFAVLWGIGSGIGPLLEPMLVGRLFGRKNYATAYGALDGVDVTVAIAGPWIGGLLFDLTGAYTAGLALYGIAFLAGSAAFAILVRETRRLERSLAGRSEVADRRREAATLDSLAPVYNSLGRPHEALNHCRQALAMAREVGDRRGEAAVLSNLAALYHKLLRPNRPWRFCEVGDHSSEGLILNGLGAICGDLGRPLEALQHYRQALAILHEVGDRGAEGAVLSNLAALYHKLLRPNRPWRFSQRWARPTPRALP